jgi:hypothetical protein
LHDAKYIVRATSLGVLAVFGSIAFPAVVGAQTISSFNHVTSISGVQVAQSGLIYTIALDSGAFVVFDGVTYDLDHIFGFWTLGDDGGLSATVTAQNGWNASQHSGPNGEIAGWHNPNQNAALFQGQQLTFTYDSLNQANVSDYGFHASFVQPLPGGANTLYIRGPLVPEPTSIGGIALGIVALVGLRRRRSAV